MIHLINGAAGNIESHSTLGNDSLLDMTAFLDQTHFGFGKLTVHNATTLSWNFIQGEDGMIGDALTLLKDSTATCAGAGGNSSAPGASGSGVTKPNASIMAVVPVSGSVKTLVPGLIGLLVLALAL